jgi:hypothetical protein
VGLNSSSQNAGRSGIGLENRIVTHGLGHGLIGAAVAAWPAVALVGSYELLMMVIRSSQVAMTGRFETGRDTDPLWEGAAEVFAEQLAADRVPSVHAIRAQLHVGQPRAQRLRNYLATASGRHDDTLVAMPVNYVICGAQQQSQERKIWDHRFR